MIPRAKFFLWVNMLLDFRFHTQEGSWIHQIFKMWYYKKKKLKYSNHLKVRQFTANFQKIQNLKKFERFNRFRPNSVPKVLDRYIIFACSLRMIARIQRKLDIFQKIQNPIKSQNGHQLVRKSSRLNGRDCFTGVLNLRMYGTKLEIGKKNWNF